MDTIFMNAKNSKTNGAYKFGLNFSQRLYLRRPNEQVAPQS